MSGTDHMFDAIRPARRVPGYQEFQQCVASLSRTLRDDVDSPVRAVGGRTDQPEPATSGANIVAKPHALYESEHGRGKPDRLVHTALVHRAGTAGIR